MATSLAQEIGSFAQQGHQSKSLKPQEFDSSSTDLSQDSSSSFIQTAQFTDNSKIKESRNQDLDQELARVSRKSRPNKLSKAVRKQPERKRVPKIIMPKEQIKSRFWELNENQILQDLQQLGWS